MPRHRTHHAHEASTGGEQPQAVPEHLNTGETGNNHAEPAAGGDNATMQRAEEMVDQLAERIGHYARVVGHEILRLGARAREEAEDIWAEAQHLRQRGQSS